MTIICQLSVSAALILSAKGVAGRESLTERREGVPPVAEISFDQSKNDADDSDAVA